jgi:diacylglycerol diphosphate phosphatase/phosphatidate phosphatase
MSFPSGHASTSFCGLGLLSFYLECRFGVSSLRKWNEDAETGELILNQTRPVRLERIKSVISYAPLILAGFIAASRVVDNKHFPADVIGGAILGASIAKLVHGVWYG